MVAGNTLAEEAGVRAGMRRREAESQCPNGVVLERDPTLEAMTFEPVVEAVAAVVPRVEVAEPGLLFVPVAGAVRYYGGERPLAERVSKEIRMVSAGARVAIAGGPFAARWAAVHAGEDPFLVDDDGAFLASLDVDALGDEDLAAVFRWLGITTFGDLSRLPRGAVASRFGSVGLAAHRLASGEDRALSPQHLPEDPAVEDRFEEPLRLLEQGGFAARSLAHRLVVQLAARGVAPYRVEVEAEAADGTLRARVWRSTDPFTEEALAERVGWQLRAWVESGGVPGGIVRLRLVPADLSDEGRQPALFEDAAARVEAERALARAQTLLGPEAVLESRPGGGRLPGERIRWHRWGETPPTVRSEEAPWPGATPDPAPALVPPAPAPVEVEWDAGMPVRIRLASRWEPILTWAGPWRLVRHWWKGEPSADRYQLVTSAGAFLCELREGRTFLLGVYD